MRVYCPLLFVLFFRKTAPINTVPSIGKAAPEPSAKTAAGWEGRLWEILSSAGLREGRTARNKSWIVRFATGDYRFQTAAKQMESAGEHFV